MHWWFNLQSEIFNLQFFILPSEFPYARFSPCPTAK
jgi:hypothetical protein